jgi:hypothetical protein
MCGAILGRGRYAGPACRLRCSKVVRTFGLLADVGNEFLPMEAVKSIAYERVVTRWIKREYVCDDLEPLNWR